MNPKTEIFYLVQFLPQLIITFNGIILGVAIDKAGH